MPRLRSLTAVLVLLIALAAAAPAQARRAYGVTGGSTLITFNTNSPGTTTSVGPVSGLQPGETILGIDVQPSNGQLFALGSESRLYTINTQTAAATLVGGGAFSPGLAGTSFGFDFNPVNGRIRVVSDDDQNIELLPTTGAAISHADINPAVGATGAAYSNNFAGATTTTLFDLVAQAAATLFTQELTPDDGSVTIGPAVAPPIASDDAASGFDIGADGLGFATLTFGGTTQLYTVDPASGVRALLGPVGSEVTPVPLALARPLETTPFAVAFGQEPVDEVGAPTAVTVTNTSDAAISVAPAVSGAHANQFALVSDTCGSSITSGSSCTLGVDFRPSRPGAAAATLGVGAAPADNATIPLTGTGVGAAVALSPKSLAFGAQTVGRPAGAQTVTVTNTGNTPLTLTSLGLGGNDRREFAISSQTCTAAPIAAGATCRLSVTFDPAGSGAKSAHVQLVDNARNGSARIDLTGTAGAPRAALSATALAFANRLVDSRSGRRTLTLRNEGNAPLAVSSVAVSGAGVRSFAVSGQACTAAPIAPGASCAITVRFEPLATGAQSATLQVHSDAPGRGPAATLTGRGLARVARAAIRPRRRSFGSRALRRATKAKAITVRSTGSAPLDVSRVRLRGRSASQFRVVSQSCTPGTLARGSRCRIKVRFRATSAGVKRARLAIVDNARGNARVSLTGRGRR